MRLLNFKKTVMRNDYTKIFGGIGKRRTVKDFMPKRTHKIKQSKMQCTRRSNVGWRNKQFSLVHKFKMFVNWGMKKRKPVSRFRR